MKMSRGKRNVLFAGVLSCAMLFGIGNTMAYFTENSVQTNVFTTGATSTKVRLFSSAK